MAFFDRTLKIFASVASLVWSTSAFAGEGQPSPWQMTFQKANSPIMEQITRFHDYLTIIIILITLFVLGLLVYVMVRFNERRHPQPSRTTHNTALEIAWTVIPILILVAIAIPSFRLLFAQYDYPKADLTITATGHQWYWTYEYPDQGIHFDAIMVQQADLKEGQPRLLTADHDLVVPVNKNIIVQVKATDVIHDWAVPSFGVKIDAVPGRLQKTWFRASAPACSTDNAPNFAVAITPSCRSRFVLSLTRSLPTGWPKPSRLRPLPHWMLPAKLPRPELDRTDRKAR